jgi:hypothetical protein
MAFGRKLGGRVKHFDVAPIQPDLITCLERGRRVLSSFPALLRFDHRSSRPVVCFPYLV